MSYDRAANAQARKGLGKVRKRNRIAWRRGAARSPGRDLFLSQTSSHGLLNALENEELAKLQLFYVLYGETLERLESEGVKIDWEYVDPTYHPLFGVPHEEVEKLFDGEYGLDDILGTR